MESNNKIMRKKENTLKNLFFATRPWVFPLAIIQITIGAVSGFWLIGKIDIIPVVLAAIGLVFLFAFTNIINDYLDFKNGVDKKKRKFQHDHPHPIISNILTPRQERWRGWRHSRQARSSFSERRKLCSSTSSTAAGLRSTASCSNCPQ